MWKQRTKTAKLSFKKKRVGTGTTLLRKFIDGATFLKMDKFKLWQYALGSYDDEKTKEFDKTITIIRTIIVGVNFITCFFIVAGVIRHWS